MSQKTRKEEGNPNPTDVETRRLRVRVGFRGARSRSEENVCRNNCAVDRMAPLLAQSVVKTA